MFLLHISHVYFTKKHVTQISVAGLAELSSSTKTEIKWQFIRLAQLASILDGCESILGVVKCHKPVVIPVTGKEKVFFFNSFWVQGFQRTNKILNPDPSCDLHLKEQPGNVARRPQL